MSFHGDLWTAIPMGRYKWFYGNPNIDSLNVYARAFFICPILLIVILLYIYILLLLYIYTIWVGIFVSLFIQIVHFHFTYWHLLKAKKPLLLAFFFQFFPKLFWNVGEFEEKKYFTDR